MVPGEIKPARKEITINEGKNSKAYGLHLDIASGTSVRFEPGEEKEVNLVEFGGSQRVFGFNGLTEAQINDTTIKRSLDNAKIKGFIK